MRRMQRTGDWLTEIDHYASYSMPPMFRALREHALRARCIYVDFFPSNVTTAMFVTEGRVTNGLDPIVAIYTPERVCNLLDADDVIRTCELAHELGHHESWLRGDASDEFEEMMEHDPRAIYDRVDDVALDLLDETIEEERRAWRYGREILAAAQIGFNAWSAFEKLAEQSVDGYAREFAASRRRCPVR